MVVLRACPGHDLDARADAVAIASGSLKSDVEPVTAVGASIHPELGIGVHGRDDNVNADIAIKVAQSSSAVARGGGFHESGLLGQRFPLSACAEIAEYRVRLLDACSRRVRC